MAPKTLLIVALLSVFATALSQPLDSQCPGTRYSENTTFQSNLHSLFSSLSSSSSSYSFNTSTSGHGNDQVYGLYFCTADLPQPNCHNCITTATSDILQSCPTNRQGIVWYDYCELRYSDEPFFGVADPTGIRRVEPGSIDSDPSWPLKVVSGLVAEAPTRRPNMFAYHASLWDQAYAMAQCSGDINGSACATCLDTLVEKIQGCCIQASGWRYYGYSCWVRFDVTPFLMNIDSSDQMIGYKCSNNGLPNTRMGEVASSLVLGGSATGLYNTSVASAGGRLYGLALCRGDVDLGECRKCLNASAMYMERNCANGSESVIWSEKCSIRQANWNFFGVVDKDARVFCHRRESIAEDDGLVDMLMWRLVEVAPGEPLMYARGNVSINDSFSGYGLVQCSRDLSNESCGRCLVEGLRNVSTTCKGKKGWGYFSGSCSLRYEDYAFFEGGGESVLWPEKKPRIRGKILIILVIAILAAIILTALLCIWLWRKKYRGSEDKQWIHSDLLNATNMTLLINIETLRYATNNFYDANKLGEGGFGPVYKGQLANGTEIAVKRLSTASSQGSREFKNEIRLIAKLHHRNLVRMLGCCVNGEEKLLVYEYLPNGSLDAFLFDADKRSMLDWRARQHIILGIARGLVYLHEESLLKVVHRDLKASNVLLDINMNAKISDFGLARIFKYDQNEAHTGMVVGTYGYMAPEYAMYGFFSSKSDIFSFGVLLLEIISGQRNGRSHFSQHGQMLLHRSWQLWQQGNGPDLIDPLMGSSCTPSEALRAIQIALLCVQEDADGRPAMSLVLHMLRNSEMVLPEAKHPPSYTMRRATSSALSSTTGRESVPSVNVVTITAVDVR